MIEMRYASEADINSLKELYISSFDEKPEAVGLFFKRIFTPENCYIAIEKDELIAMVHMLPTMINGKQARYLYTAATKAEFRGFGIMDGLVKAALSVYAPEICVTLPADDSLYDYYKRFKFKPLEITVAELSRDEAVTLSKSFEEQELVVENYCGIRNRVLKDNFLFWNNNHINYAFDYNELYGAKIIKSNFGYAIAYEENGICEVSEFICADEHSPQMLSLLIKEFDSEKFRIKLSPNQKFFGNTHSEKFAMARYATKYEPEFIYSGLTLE